MCCVLMMMMCAALAFKHCCAQHLTDSRSSPPKLLAHTHAHTYGRCIPSNIVGPITRNATTHNEMFAAPGNGRCPKIPACVCVRSRPPWLIRFSCRAGTRRAYTHTWIQIGCSVCVSVHVCVFDVMGVHRKLLYSSLAGCPKMGSQVQMALPTAGTLCATDPVPRCTEKRGETIACV